jgi:hypothetical protein
LDCDPIAGSSPAFSPASSLVTVVSGGRLVQYGSDGIQKAVLLNRGVSDAL